MGWTRTMVEDCTRNDPTKSAQSWGTGNTNGPLGRESRRGPWEREEGCFPTWAAQCSLQGCHEPLASPPPCFVEALWSAAHLRLLLSSHAWGEFPVQCDTRVYRRTTWWLPKMKGHGTDNLISLLISNYGNLKILLTQQNWQQTVISAVGFH